MPPPLIENRDARRLVLALQGLGGGTGRLTRAALGRLIDDMGYVQVDSINTVARAHDLILFARHPGYRPSLLRHLLERERSLFENWTHDAAIIPSRFYPYWRPRFARAEALLIERWRRWRRAGFEAMIAQVLRRIADEGPVLAREVGADEERSAGGWWDWHPSKTALEYLWRTGRLAVTRRQGFQKVYDLAERVIPAEHRRHEASRRDYVDWACRQALARLGVAGAGELADFWGDLSAAEAQAWARRNLDREVVEVLVAAADGGRPWRAYARPDAAEQAGATPPAPGRLRVLSPFDPLIRNRRRSERLFGFRYRIEVFVPEAKRQFGYYVFPLLEGERLVGRLDMRRRDGALAVDALWLEPGLGLGRARQRRLEGALDRLARFAGAERVVFADGWLKSP